MKEEYKSRLEYITHFYMDLGWRSQYVGVLGMNYEGIQYYFIDNEFYFAYPRPYGNIYEDIEKFAFSQRQLSRSCRMWTSVLTSSTAMTGRRVWFLFS